MKLLNSSKLIIIGYALLAVFIASSITFLKNNDKAIEAEYQRLIFSQNQAQEILQMQIYGKKRMVYISQLLFEEDPFTQDQYIQKFLIAGNQFGIILDRLIAREMPSDEKQKILDLQKGVFANATNQYIAMDLVLEEQYLKAQDTYLLTIPMQNITMAQLNELVDISLAESKKAEQKYQEIIEQDELLSKTLNSVLFIFTLILAFFSYRLSKANERYQEAEIHQLNTEIDNQITLNEMDALILHAVDEHIVLLDDEGFVVRANPSYQELIDSNEYQMGLPAWELLQEICKENLSAIDIKNELQNGKSWHSELDLQEPLNYFGLCQIQPFASNEIPQAKYLLTIKNITQLNNAQMALQQQANYDPVTSLPNRRFFQEKLLNLINGETPSIALLYIDIDDFKNVNDSLGHHFGDYLLKEISQRMQGVITRSTSQPFSIARIGGDEFAVIVEFASIEQQAKCSSMMDSIIKQLREPYIVQSQKLDVNCSMGLAFYPDHGETPTELMRNADLAMYQAKHLGKNQYTVFNDYLAQQLADNLTLKEELLLAIKKQVLTMHYQPQYALNSDEVIGLEALIRWGDDKPLYRPDQFIGFAEENGLIHLIDDYVIDQVCQQIHHWHQQGLAVPRVAINISSQLVNSKQLVKTIKHNLKHYHLSGSMLELEITEHSLVENLQTGQDQESWLNQLDELGIHIAVDDFGTGYSSLSYLQFMKVNRLKIDRSFIKNMSISKENLAIVDSIVSLAHNIKATALAEGIETQQQYQELIKLGCDEGQGFLMSKPLNVEKMTELLKAQSNKTQLKIS